MKKTAKKNMAYLEFLSDMGEGRLISLDGDNLVVGRSDDCELTVVDGRVSRKHAHFQLNEDRWLVRDMGSKNGITLNGDNVSEKLLDSGDVVGIGPILLRFLDGPPKLPPEKVMDREGVTYAMGEGLGPPESQRRLKLLLEIASAIDSFGSTEDLLEQFLDLVVHLFNPTCCVLRIREDEEHFFSERGTEAKNNDAIISDDIRRRVLVQGETILGGSMAAEPGRNDLKHSGFRSIRSFMATPIFLADRTAGLLYVDQRRRKQGDFDQSDMMVLVGVGRLVSAAVASSNRFARIQGENLILQNARGPAGMIVGQSQTTRALLELIQERIGPVKSTVLLTGETGTGKSLVAEAIHLSSPRAKKPFVKVNCAAIPRELLESELFGHEKGSFSGATARKIGLFESATSGTLFLDEVGELDQVAQSKLLTVIQDNQLLRVGGTKPIDIDVRIVAATNRNLGRAVEEKLFRSDLYYRLNVVQLEIPPLRQRPEDIPALANHFLERACREVGRRVIGFSSDVMEMLSRYAWPGNIRELSNCVERAVIFADEEAPVEPWHLPQEIRADVPMDGQKPLEEKGERKAVLDAMEQAAGNKREAARILGWYPQKLYSRLKKYSIG